MNGRSHGANVVRMIGFYYDVWQAIALKKKNSFK